MVARAAERDRDGGVVGEGQKRATYNSIGDAMWKGGKRKEMGGKAGGGGGELISMGAPCRACDGGTE